MDANSDAVALITGASSGIGFELARCFAEDGHRLIVAADDGPELGRCVPRDRRVWRRCSSTSPSPTAL